MSTLQRFSLLRKTLKMLGSSVDRYEKLMADPQVWLLDDQLKMAGVPPHPFSFHDGFFSSSNLKFYLQTVVSSWAIIFAKALLSNMFLAQTGDRGKKVLPQ